MMRFALAVRMTGLALAMSALIVSSHAMAQEAVADTSAEGEEPPRSGEGPLTGQATAGPKLFWAWVDASDAEAGPLKRKLLNGAADADTVAAWLCAGRPDRPIEPRKSPWEEIQVTGADGKERTHVLRVPKGFTSWDQRHPLVVELHGGVAYPKPRSTKDMQETNYAFSGGMIDEVFYLQPKGTSAATWFDPVGSDNVLRAIREVRRRYPIHPNRIYLGGFSDGGHGAYYFSAFHATCFAGFLPLNGQPLGAQLRGGQVYLRNMTNKPMYVVATGRDFISPPSAIKPFMDILKELGAPLTYRVYEKMPHAPLYLTKELELPRITAWLKKTVREPYPKALVWETADLTHSPGLHWLYIRRIGDVGNNHPFPDVNARRGSNRVRLGVHVDPQWNKPGVRVQRLAKGWPAEGMGIEAGDVIVAVDGNQVRSRNDLSKALKAKSFGDGIEVSVRRTGRDEPLKLKGRFPKDQRTNLLRRKKPHGSIRARQEGNRFDVQVQNVAEFSLLLSPDTVDFAKPVTVTVNGKAVFEKKVPPSLETTLEWARRLADPAQVYTAELNINTPSGNGDSAPPED